MRIFKSWFLSPDALSAYADCTCAIVRHNCQSVAPPLSQM